MLRVKRNKNQILGARGGGGGHDIWVIYLQIKNKSSL